MVKDRFDRPHRPKNLPQGWAGTVDGKAGSVGDSDLPPDETDMASQIPGVVAEHVETPAEKRERLRNMSFEELTEQGYGAGNTSRSREIRERLEHKDDEAWRLWRDQLLGASEPEVPGVHGGRRHSDYRGEPVISDEEEQKLVDRATSWTDEDGRVHHGPIYRGIEKWFSRNEAQCDRLARQIAEARIDALRRSCVVHPWMAYSPRLVNYALMTMPVRVETLFAGPPWHLSAHRMRVGVRYKKATDQWIENHRNRLPNASERDRIWDRTMLAFVKEKMDAGKSFGRGMTLSNGVNADPRAKTGKIRVDQNGKPFNGRVDFETMLDGGENILCSGNRDFETIMQLHANEARPVTAATPDPRGEQPTAANLSAGGPKNTVDDEGLHDLWLVTRKRGLDANRFASEMNVAEENVARWEAQYTSGEYREPNMENLARYGDAILDYVDRREGKEIPDEDR